MLDLCRNALPNEACGLLYGTESSDEIRICRIVPVFNAAENPLSSFTLDPASLVKAVYGAARGEPLIGVYHSHPRSGPRPSRRDLNGWWPFSCQLIVSLAAADHPEIFAYQIKTEAEHSASVPRLEDPAGYCRELPFSVIHP